MKKTLTILITLFFAFSIIGCKKEETVQDICEGVEDCIVLNDEDAKERARDFTWDYVEMTNKELEQIHRISTWYTFNYFTESPSTLSNGYKEDLARVFTTFAQEEEFSSTDNHYSDFTHVQWELLKFKLDELVSNEKQYMVIDGVEHFVFKPEEGLARYYIIDGETTSTFDFNLYSNNIIDFNQKFNHFQDYYNDLDFIEFNDNYFSLNKLIESNDEHSLTISYIHDDGGYLVILTQNEIQAIRTSNTGTHLNIVSKTFDVEYNTTSKLYTITNQIDNSAVEVSYTEFYKTVLFHPNLNQEISNWMYHTNSETVINSFFTE